MFEHFRPLFICAFQINATFLYLVPLSLRLREEPLLLATSLMALTAIFKSYPSLGDVGFYLSLLPMWKHLFNRKFLNYQIFKKKKIHVIFFQICNKDLLSVVFSL